MNGCPTGFRTILDTPDGAPGVTRGMARECLTGRDGPARLAFESDTSWRHAAPLDR